MEYLMEYQEWLACWLGVAGVANARTRIGEKLTPYTQRMTSRARTYRTYFSYSCYSILYVY